MDRPRRLRKPSYKLLQNDDLAPSFEEAEDQTEQRKNGRKKVKSLTAPKKDSVATGIVSVDSTSDGADVIQEEETGDEEGNILADFLPNPEKLFNWPPEEEGNFSICINICLHCKGGFLLEDDLAKHKCHKRSEDPRSQCDSNDENSAPPDGTATEANIKTESESTTEPIELDEIKDEKIDDTSDIDSPATDQPDICDKQTEPDNKEPCILPKRKAGHIKISGVLVKNESKKRKAKNGMSKVEEKHKYDLERYIDKYKIIGNDRGEKKYQCLVCERIYKSTPDLQKTLGHHLYTHKIGKLQCKICGYEAKNDHNLRYHRDLHISKDNPFVCETCGAEFQVRYNLWQHVKNVHKSKPICQHCGESFSTHRPLKRHIELMHNGEGLFSCTICNEKYTTRVLLTHHKTSYHNGGPKVCPFCGKTIKTDHNLKEHIERVHQQIKNFACDQCSFTTYRKQQLTYHLRTHTGERPFKCTLCNWAGIKRYSLVRHMNSHKVSEVPCYKCSLCDFTAATRTQVEEHQVEEHQTIHIELERMSEDLEEGEAVSAFEEQGNVVTEIIQGDPEGTAVHSDLE